MAGDLEPVPVPVVVSSVTSQRAVVCTACAATRICSNVYETMFTACVETHLRGYDLCYDETMFTVCVETNLRGYDLCYVMCRPVRCTRPVHSRHAAQAPQPVSPYPRTCAPRNPIRRAPYAHARPRSSHTRRVHKAVAGRIRNHAGDHLASRSTHLLPTAGPGRVLHA